MPYFLAGDTCSKGHHFLVLGCSFSGVQRFVKMDFRCRILNEDKKNCCSFLEKNPVISRRCPSKMVWLKMLISSYSSWGNFWGKLMSLQQQPRFYKVADLSLSYIFRNKATDSYGSKYWWLQGLAAWFKGQICNPVLYSFFLPPFCGVLVGIEQNILQFLLLGWCVNHDSGRGVHPWDANEKR